MRMKSVLFLLAAVAALSAPAVSLQTNAFPRVWMSLQWGPGMDAKVADLAAHGVEVIEVSSGSEQVCREALALCRKYGLKAFVYADDITKRSTPALKGRPYERAVMLGGAYRGQAIDRTLFSFTPERHEIVIEPPVYSRTQAYLKFPHYMMRGDGHYYGQYVPTGRAEIVVPEKLFDGRQHLKIIPVVVKRAPADAVVGNDTVVSGKLTPTDDLRNRYLVELEFDLTGLEKCRLDKVGIAVYWRMENENPAFNPMRGCYSLFAASTRAAQTDWMLCGLNGRDARSPEADDYRKLDPGPEKADDPSNLIGYPFRTNDTFFTSSHQVRDLPGFRSVYELIADRARELAVKRTPKTRAELREIVRRRAGMRALEDLRRETEDERDFKTDFNWWYLKGLFGVKAENKAAILSTLGRSYVGEQAEELLRKAAADVAANGGNPVVLKAKGWDCIAAAHAYAAEPQLFSRVEFTDRPPSWTEMAVNPDTKDDSFAVGVWGALVDYDWVDLVK